MRLLGLIMIVTALVLLGADALTSLERGGEITVRSFGHGLGRAQSGITGPFQELGAALSAFHGPRHLFVAGDARLGLTVWLALLWPLSSAAARAWSNPLGALLWPPSVSRVLTELTSAPGDALARTAKIDAPCSGACLRMILPILPRNPQHIAHALIIGGARHHEQMIGKPVDISQRGGIDLFFRRQRHDGAFGPPRDGARQMQMRRERRAARQDERSERRQASRSWRRFPAPAARPGRRYDPQAPSPCGRLPARSDRRPDRTDRSGCGPAWRPYRPRHPAGRSPMAQLSFVHRADGGDARARPCTPGCRRPARFRPNRRFWCRFSTVSPWLNPTDARLAPANLNLGMIPRRPSHFRTNESHARRSPRNHRSRRHPRRPVTAAAARWAIRASIWKWATRISWNAPIATAASCSSGDGHQAHH